MTGDPNAFVSFAPYSGMTFLYTGDNSPLSMKRVQ